MVKDGACTDRDGSRSSKVLCSGINKIDNQKSNKALVKRLTEENEVTPGILIWWAGCDERLFYGF
jgi:hypothetical protein